jgi:DNA invertase Pin-like site-specific DNA recombinase
VSNLSPVPTKVTAAIDEMAPRPKAYSYIRFSTKRQAKGDSLLRQVEKSRLYAAENGLDLQEKTFEDLGVSAFDRSNVTRGALAAFIQTVESGAIERGSYLLVESLDRLSRADVLDAMALLSRLVKLGIRVVTVIDGRVLDEESIKEPMNIMYAVLVFVRANEESETKAHRVQKAHQRKREAKSLFAFGQGPGWLRPDADRTGWELIPEKADSVRRVFDCAASGMGLHAIARLANQERWPVPGRADDWHKTLPLKLLKNRRVLGELDPQTKDGKVRRPTGEHWEGYYPAVVSEAVFNAAQAALANRRALPQRRDEGYHNVFQGILKCGHCGATLARKPKSSSRNSPGYAIYVCADRDRGLTRCQNWNARELEEALLPPLMTSVSAEILHGHATKQAVDELEQVRAALAQGRHALANLLGIVERTGGSDTVASRIRHLEVTQREHAERAAQLQAIANDPVTELWEEDLDQAIVDALRAVRDITTARTAERAALHLSFIRVVESIWVWPRSHAAVKARGDTDVVLLLLSATAAEFLPRADAFAAAALASMPSARPRREVESDERMAA